MAEPTIIARRPHFRLRIQTAGLHHIVWGETMPKLGIVFNTRKLGEGYRGHLALGALMRILSPRDLAGCTLHQGEVVSEGPQVYCVAVETYSYQALGRIREKVAACSEGALLPPAYRFLEEDEVDAAELAEACRVSLQGTLSPGSPRWVMEAWRRPALAEMANSPAGLGSAKRELEWPGVAPFPVRMSNHGRRVGALVLGIGLAAVLSPWCGVWLTLCAVAAAVGISQGIAMAWRVSAERRLSSEAELQKLKNFVDRRPLEDLLVELDCPWALASPLLRTLQAMTGSWTRMRDSRLAESLVCELRATDSHLSFADQEELRFLAWMTPAAAFSGFVITGATWDGARWFAVTGAAGWMAVQGIRLCVSAASERMWAEVRRLAIAEWLPVLESRRSGPQSLSGPERARAGRRDLAGSPPAAV